MDKFNFTVMAELIIFVILRAVEDIDLWLNEIEGYLASQDLGKVCSECFN